MTEEQIAQSLVERALAGDLRAVDIIADLVAGEAAQIYEEPH